MRICSLLPSATEIAFALGLGDHVVGVTHECDYPPEARSKPVLVHSRFDPERQSSREIEATVAGLARAGRSVYAIDDDRFRRADPDLILTQELCDVCALDRREVAAAAEGLSRRPKIVALNAGRLADVLTDIERVGEAAGRRSEADRLASEMRRRIEDVKTRTAAADRRPRVVCLEWLDPLYSAGHWVPEMVELAGGVNGLAAAGTPSAKIDWPSVAEFAPEAVVLMPCGFGVERTLAEAAPLGGLPGWHSLPAVRRGRVFAVNGHAYFNRPGPRLIDGLELLGQILHPEIFPWKAPAADARRVAAD